MNTGPNEFALFLGHFHPVLVHLPIGALLLLGMLEGLELVPRFKGAAQNRRLILGVAALGCVAAAGCGWLLARSGDYDPARIRFHQYAGFALAAACVGTWVATRWERRWVYRSSLMATLALVMVAGHLGGSITHGADFLTRYAPAPLRSLLGTGNSHTRPALVPTRTAQTHVFTEIVKPILDRRCIECHGPEKQKGGLLMESYASLMKGGKDGPAVVPGRAGDSPILQRLLLPASDDDHMPPSQKPQPTPAEIDVLRWWIDQGAPADAKVSDLQPTAEIERQLKTALEAIN